MTDVVRIAPLLAQVDQFAAVHSEDRSTPSASSCAPPFGHWPGGASTP